MAEITAGSRPNRLSFDLTDFGSRIVESRNRKEWTQRALADRSGLFASRLSKLERGLRMPKLEECLRLAATLGLGLEELVLGPADDDAQGTPTPGRSRSWPGEAE